MNYYINVDSENKIIGRWKTEDNIDDENVLRVTEEVYPTITLGAHARKNKSGAIEISKEELVN